MKRKIPPKTDPVVPASLLEQAKRSISADRLPKDGVTKDGRAAKPDRLNQPEHVSKVVKCLVCGGETTAVGDEPLCWVCRRLKISAWREIEQQMPVQE
jgi:hypothetical protein